MFNKTAGLVSDHRVALLALVMRTCGGNMHKRLPSVQTAHNAAQQLEEALY